MLNSPYGITCDAISNIYISDSSNHVIRKITYNTGIITTIAGNNSIGYTGDGTNATLSQLNYPTSISLDCGSSKNGNIYISDRSNHVIRKISIKTNIITTIAGTGFPGFNNADFANSTLLYSPGTVYLSNLYLCYYR
jgi:hypothetical protein